MKETLFFDIGDQGIVIYSNLTKRYELYSGIEREKLGALRLMEANNVVSFNGKNQYSFGRENYDYRRLKKALGNLEPTFKGEHLDMMEELCTNNRFTAFFSHSLDKVYQKVFKISDMEMDRIHKRMEVGINDIILDVFQTYQLWKCIQDGVIDEIHEYWHEEICEK